ncbi:MAG: hypothetical protein ACOYJF_10085 [Prevotella sp.]|jgi:hypothetical protein
MRTKNIRRVRRNGRRAAGIMLLTAGLLCLVGCKGNRVKQIAHDFLSQNLKTSDFDIIDCSKVDSTTRVTPANLSKMRKATANMWKANVHYATATHQLRYAKLSFVLNKDTLHQTFYLNNDMTGVVGVKNEVR